MPDPDFQGLVQTTQAIFDKITDMHGTMDAIKTELKRGNDMQEMSRKVDGMKKDSKTMRDKAFYQDEKKGKGKKK